MYRKGSISVVVLPSITTKYRKEGIPVALMEAMAYKIPVISTNTGGIPELLLDDAGIMVPERDSLKISEAIEKIILDNKLRTDLGIKGNIQVKNNFDVKKNVKNLIGLFIQK